MKKVLKELVFGIVTVFLLLTLTGCDLLEDDDDGIVENVSNEKYTLMIYICGSNLESDGGYATDDIEEMMESQLAEEVNLLIYTGGASSWYSEDIADDRNQIFELKDKELNLVDDTIGMKYMSEPDTLTYFINFAKKNYPASKYGLILWDHGGGAVSGFGYDEHNPDEEATLTIDEIKTAISKSNLKLDFIGFDACLMGTVETAYALKDNANYLIASEEIEPGTGWDYKKSLNQISRDTSQNAEDLGRVIIDSFIKSNNGFFGADATLSMTDLRKIDNVYSKLESFIKDIKIKNFDTNEYATVSKNLKESKSYAEGEIDTIDLVDFATKMNLPSSSDLINAINDCVVYNNTTDYVSNSNGLSIYFPNEELDYYEPMVNIYKNIGFSDEYINIMNEYVNLKAGGAKGSYTVNNNTYSTDENYEQYSWFDSDLIDSFSDYYDETCFDSSELKITDKGDYFALHLTDEEWENIVSIDSSVWYDDGEGYIDFGTDTYYEFDNDGDLKIIFDGEWLAINGQTVMYNVVEETDKYEKAKVPAYLNDEEVNLIVYWDYENSKVEVLGAEPVDAYGNTTLHGRGYIEIKQGDRIEFLVDYYDYYGEYDDYYIYGDEIIVGKDGLNVDYQWIGDGECLVYYILTDIYNNVYYTESVTLY